MTEKPINMMEWAKWFKFDTCGERPLEAMLHEAARFTLDIKEKKRARWVSFLGTSGAGKTYLGRQIYKKVIARDWIKTEAEKGREIEYATEFCYWPELADQLQIGKGREWVQDLARCKFLFLDDLGAKKDNTGFITGELSTLLGQRVEKWTILTANMGLKAIGDQIDPRLASRMIRDGNRIIDVDVMDYSRRNKNK